MDDIDASAVSSAYEKAKAALSGAEAGSAAHAEAMIEVEVNRSMGEALGLTMA